MRIVKFLLASAIIVSILVVVAPAHSFAATEQGVVQSISQSVSDLFRSIGKWFTSSNLLSAVGLSDTGQQIYISQNGTGDGSSCISARSISWLNTVSNWGDGVLGKIGAGDTVHLCGTINFPAKSTGITVPGSGTAGQPITIYFEPGASLVSPSFYGEPHNSLGGAIRIANRQHIVIDGGQNGVIRNTNTGTYGYNNTATGEYDISGTTGIVIASSQNVEVKNITLADLYVASGDVPTPNHPGRLGEVPGSTNTAGIRLGGDNNSGINIHNNKIVNVGLGMWISMNPGTSMEVHHNEITQIGDGMFIAGGNRTGDKLIIHHNKIYDTTKYGYTEGIKIFSAPVSAPLYGLSIYSNTIGPDISIAQHPASAWIFLSDGVFMSPKIYDNLLIAGPRDATIHFISVVGPNPLIASYPQNAEVYNNTMISKAPAGIWTTGITFGNNNTGNIVKNNIIYSSDKMIPLTAGKGAYISQSDYNSFYSGTGVYSFYYNDVSFNQSCAGTTISARGYTCQLSEWQQKTGFDLHSTRGVNPNLDASYRPNANSPIIDKGTSLASEFAVDFDDKTRPQGTGWDIGAFEYGAPVVLPVSYSLNTSATNGTISRLPNQTVYNAGSLVTLTATPNAGYNFSGWSGALVGSANPAVLLMDGNKSLTAGFVAIPIITYNLFTGATNGSITRSPNQVSYNYGTVVTLTATPVSGYSFSGWTGDVSGTANPVSLTMNGNKTVTANFTANPVVPPVVGTGVGVIGDSNSDEYRANDNRAGGTSYAATTLNWVEQLVKAKNINFGAWGVWSEPRRAGYKYNWARSGATNLTMISQGQHTGLAAQIKAGEVGTAVIYIGVNDFSTQSGVYGSIYNGTLSGTALQNYLNTILSNITLAVDTLKSAGNVRILVVNYADPGMSANTQFAFPNATNRQRVTNAVNTINSSLNSMASTRSNVKIIDQKNFASQLLAQVDVSGNLPVGGEKISMTVKGYEPHHAQLSDSYGHPGTVLSGIMANKFFLEGSNLNFGSAYSLMTDSQLLTNAGIVAVAPTSYSLSASASTGGSVSRSPNQSAYSSGLSVIVTGVPTAGYQFVNWTGDLTGSINPASVLMDKNKTIKANFSAVPVTYSLSISATNGSVTKSPNQTSYNSGTSVSLTATPATGYTFSGWSGDLTGSVNPVSVVMDKNRTIGANFSAVPVTYSLSVSATNGTVTKSPNQTSYNSGNSVTLTATPNSGYTFSGWSGALTGNTNPAVITMNGNKSVTANFSAVSVPPIIPPQATGEQIYISQYGTGDGSSCSNSHSFNWFALYTHWGTGSDKISAGDTVHFCGSFTFGVRKPVSSLSVVGLGTIANPVTWVFESGSKIDQDMVTFFKPYPVGTVTIVTVDGTRYGVLMSNSPSSIVSSLNQNAAAVSESTGTKAQSNAFDSLFQKIIDFLK